MLKVESPSNHSTNASSLPKRESGDFTTKTKCETIKVIPDPNKIGPFGLAEREIWEAGQ